MKRPMTPTDLEDKGVPFACVNCGNRPTLDEVISGDCVCQLCGDAVIAYTLDTALMLKRLIASSKPAGYIHWEEGQARPDSLPEYCEIFDGMDWMPETLEPAKWGHAERRWPKPGPARCVVTCFSCGGSGHKRYLGEYPVCSACGGKGSQIVEVKARPITFRTITVTPEEQENRRRVPWCSLSSDVQSYFEGARAAGMPIERLYLSTWSPDTFGVFVPHGVYRVGVKA